jgi:hypothetical protein
MSFAELTRRLQAILLLAMVLSVPALTRASQHVTSATTTREVAGFSTSADAAPEKVIVSPRLDVVVIESIDATPPIRRAWLVRRTDERLPFPPLVSAVRSLRAPPSFAFL